MNTTSRVHGRRPSADTFATRRARCWAVPRKQMKILLSSSLVSFHAYRWKLGTVAMDSLRFRPKSVGGTFDIVTTEWRLPPGCGAGDCERVARKACSTGVGPLPPRSDKRRTWLAVIPLVQGGVGRECFRVSRGSRQGESKYGLLGESMSKLWRGDADFWLSRSSSFSSCSDSSTTISGSWWRFTVTFPKGENAVFLSFARVSAIKHKKIIV